MLRLCLLAYVCLGLCSAADLVSYSLMAFAYDTVWQDICYIFNYIDSAIAFAKRHHQSIPCTCTVIAENPGEDDTRSILKAWSRSVAHVDTSSVSHCLNENNLDLA